METINNTSLQTIFVFTLLCLPIEILSYYSMTTFKLPRKQKNLLKSNIYMNKTQCSCAGLYVLQLKILFHYGIKLILS